MGAGASSASVAGETAVIEDKPNVIADLPSLRETCHTGGAEADGDLTPVLRNLRLERWAMGIPEPLQEAAPSVRVLGFEVVRSNDKDRNAKEPYVVYRVSTTSESGRQWETLRRWSDLRALESALRASDGDALRRSRDVLPRLEPHSWLQFNRLDPAFLANRSKQMQDMLQAWVHLFALRFEAPGVGPESLRSFLDAPCQTGEAATWTPRRVGGVRDWTWTPEAKSPATMSPDIKSPATRSLEAELVVVEAAVAVAAADAVAQAKTKAEAEAAEAAKAAAAAEAAEAASAEVAAAAAAEAEAALSIDTRSKARMDSLAKPPGSLGLLEEWSLVLCRMQRTLSPVATPQSVIVFCADHGVKRCDPSISPFPQLVTCAVFRALAAGVSATGVLARAAGAALTVVDCGIDGVVDDVQPGSSSIRVRHAKLAKGTADMRTSPAMDEEGVEAALELGRACVREEVARHGARVIAIGEVGIGNTTSAAALLAALTGVAPCECCGRGTGLDDAGLRHKEAVVSVCCANHQSALEFAPTPSARAKEALRRLGGFELAAMAGAYIEAERAGVVAVVDGFISAVAALCAVRLHPDCRRAMVFSTALAEEPSMQGARGGAVLANALGARVALSMDLRLGEASGAALALPMLHAAAAIPCQMATLQAALTLGSPAPLLADSKLRAAWSLRSKVTLAIASLLLACVVVVRPRLPR